MHPLNPFLRAFFRSTVPGQCVPVENHVLLVPTTESLFASRDKDSNAYYSDLVSSEEFLGSHVLRIPNTSSSSPHKSDVPNARDARGKAKQVTTVNGRTVIVKENSIYSNKGFKSLCQAQILSDVLYHTPNHNSQPWLIYYISRPLIGNYDAGKIVPAIPAGIVSAMEGSHTQNPGNTSSVQKRNIKSFAQLLAQFPMIARQMQPGLDRLFREFGKELGKPLPPPPSQSPASVTKPEQWDTDINQQMKEVDRLPFNSDEYFADDEDLMRRSLETAVTAAIDLFRLVDKQQLSHLGATTELTGPLVERMIEKHVVQQVHESLLFPRLCNFRRNEDVEVDMRIRQIEHIDVSQVGIAIEGGLSGKKQLMARLSRGVDEFRKMNDATCPQEMLDVLLATIKAVTIPDEADQSLNSSEKQVPFMTVNADVLVSMLLVVVIRSQVRHLQTRLLYMQHFIFVDDVESGEIGYALNTLEVVLTYLISDYAPLRKASIRNKKLWQATKTGNIRDMRSILEPNQNGEDEDFSTDNHSQADPDTSDIGTPAIEQQSIRFAFANGNPPDVHAKSETYPSPSEPPPLSHVFPFQTWAHNMPSDDVKRSRKRVSMDVGSVSGSSVISLLSRTTTIASAFSGIEGDTSIETLSHTHDPVGDSVLMMAVESHQSGALKYLLSLQEYYSIDIILEDTNRDGTTLLSAAVQHANKKIVNIITEFLLAEADLHTISNYLSKTDVRGRTVAHYLFSAPYLMSTLGSLLPWQQKDKHGQTPLFAICRSYDHSNYQAMVNEALTVAQRAQDDGGPLRIGDHVDLKGNTLLHIVSDPVIIGRILAECDCDPNATNDKKFTPLMVASKYGRVDLMRRLFADPRVDSHITEGRGLTAIELAKDDEVRNRIDDMILFLHPPVHSGDITGRITTVVRSLFVEDATVRFILKSGAQSSTDSNLRNGVTNYTITTCRRSFGEFEHLARCLAVEHPASYIPSIFETRNPFQIHSKPSRAVLHDMQTRLDHFLRILLTHPTFSTHEMLWEFFLMPEMQPDMMVDRSQRKASALYESIYDDYIPITPDGIRDTEQFVAHAQEVVRAVHANTRSVIRRGHSVQHAAFDFGDAVGLCASILSTFKPPSNALPVLHIEAFTRYAFAMSTSSSDSSPLLQFLAVITSIQSTITAVLNALSRPGRLISSLSSTNRNLSRSRSSLASTTLPRKFNLNISVLEESRQKNIRELEQKIKDAGTQAARLSREISWNKDVVMGELAGWTSWRENVGRDAIRAFVRATVVQEKERGRRLERCLRNIKELPSLPHTGR